MRMRSILAPTWIYALHCRFSRTPCVVETCHSAPQMMMHCHVAVLCWTVVGGSMHPYMCRMCCRWLRCVAAFPHARMPACALPAPRAALLTLSLRAACAAAFFQLPPAPLAFPSLNARALCGHLSSAHARMRACVCDPLCHLLTLCLPYTPALPAALWEQCTYASSCKQTHLACFLLPILWRLTATNEPNSCTHAACLWLHPSIRAYARMHAYVRTCLYAHMKCAER